VEYVKAFVRRGPTTLPDDATTESVTEDCRFAALEFMSGVAAGWRKIDLVLWLTDAYARATRHVQRGERSVSLEPQEIPDTDIEELLVRVRAQLLASLETAVLSEGRLDFVPQAVDKGFVVRASTPDGEPVWVPVNGTRMRLRDRVESLFATDWLNDSESWSELFVCHRCEAVVFDQNAKELGVCASHKRISGIVTRDDDDADTARERVGGDHH
jgi:hypothetical protein